MDPASAPTTRDVRLSVGGPLPEDWDDLSTPLLQLRWASAVAYANRTLAEPPSEAAAAALGGLAEALDRRGALLRVLPATGAAERVAAAVQRLHVTGTIARSVGLPRQLRDLAREDAVETVRAVWHDGLTVAELRSDQGRSWEDRDLARFIDAARQLAADRAATPAPLPGETHTAPPADGPAGAAPAAEVVDIAIPHRTALTDPDPAVR